MGEPRTWSALSRRVEEAGAILWEGDPTTWEFRFVSPAAERLMGYPVEQWLSEAGFWLDHVHPDDRESIAAFCERETAAGRDHEFEYRMLAADGSVVWLRDVVRVEMDGDGRPRRFFGVMMDITAIRETAEAGARGLPDPGTGFLARNSFRAQLNSELELASAETCPRGVVVVSIPDVVDLRDQLGDDFASRVLVALSRQLRNADLASVVAIGRTGYNELAFVMRPDGDASTLLDDARGLLGVIGQPVQVDGQPVMLSAAAGLAMFPGHGDNASLLLQRALVAVRYARRYDVDIAMYSPELEGDMAAVVSLFGELPGAIKSGQLELYYQPVFSVPGGQVVALEALVRWNHPARGRLLAGEFIPIAETTGVVRQVTGWVIGAAIKQLHLWDLAGIRIPVSVNLSARDLADESLPEQVAVLLQMWGVDGSLLKFEVTERTVIHEVKRAIDALNRLRGLGATLSLDDFGVGQAGYNYLVQLPVTEVKIDRQFIVDALASPSTRLILDSLTKLLHRLGYQEIAEGVEDQVTLDMLAEIGISAAQGFHLARPMPAGDVTAILSQV